LRHFTKFELKFDTISKIVIPKTKKPFQNKFETAFIINRTSECYLHPLILRQNQSSVWWNTPPAPAGPYPKSDGITKRAVSYFQ
jgi:hypothetical protein